MDCIDSFRNEYDFLSNFFETSIQINGYTFTNAEAAFQSFKELERQEDFTTITGKKAKSLGKRVKLRADWEEVKVGIMYEVVLAKFSQNEELKEKLLATGDATLIEGNTWNDRFWGVCRGKGQNKLGLILERVRAELREE